MDVEFVPFDRNKYAFSLLLLGDMFLHENNVWLKMAIPNACAGAVRFRDSLYRDGAAFMDKPVYRVVPVKVEGGKVVFGFKD
jgi:hypothetical protein